MPENRDDLQDEPVLLPVTQIRDASFDDEDDTHGEDEAADPPARGKKSGRKKRRDADDEDEDVDDDDAEERAADDVDDDEDVEEDEEEEDDSERSAELIAPNLTSGSESTQKRAFVKFTKDIATRVNELSKRGHFSGQEKANMITAVKKLQREMVRTRKAAAASGRKGPDAGGGEAFSGRMVPAMKLDPPKGMSRLHYNLIAQAPEEITYVGHINRDWMRTFGVGPEVENFAKRHGLSDTWREKMRELQWLNDTMNVADMLLWGNGETEYAQRSASKRKRLQSTRFWKDWKKLTDDFKRAAGTALDTQTADQGLEWVPTLMSSQLQRRIEVDLVVAPLFRRIAMPSPIYQYPIMGADTIAYKVAENLEETGGASIPSRTFTTQKMQLAAIKLATRMMASSEIVEDSVVSIVPIIIEQIAKSISRAIDDAILNGDADGSHMDNDVSTTTDARTSWDGLRKMGLAYTNGAKQDAGAAAIPISKLLAIRGGMGVYAARPGQAVWITGFESLLQLMQATDGTNQVFLTMDKFGPGFISVSGQLGQVLGSPVIMSEFMREDLNATGVNSATALDNTKGAILYANREAFVLGERRALTINRSSERHIERDQLVYVSTWRGDFKPFWAQPTEKIVGILYNTL